MVDICILVEGAYPFISGGVSSWLHALITHLPEFRFAVIHISSKPDPERKLKYTLPPNVVEFREIFIHDVRIVESPARDHGDPAVWQTLREAHQHFATGDFSSFPAMLRWLAHEHLSGFTPADLFAAPESWELLIERCEAQAADRSFVDYFWTFRFTHLPLFSLIQAQLPPALIYHAISAGFNGWLGGLAKLRTGRPFLLTEHGIYLREREIEIAQADWIYAEPREDYQIRQRLSFFQEWWLNMFRYIARFTYDRADKVISIARINQRYQLRDSAAPEKLLLIPNGIDTAQLATLRATYQPRADQYMVCFVGRVVSIKDVKTFLRAINLARQLVPQLSAWIVGPYDEDQEYYQECRELTAALDLEACVTYTGPANVREFYAKMDVLVLTSLSEGQPLVILEGNAAGIPVVATHVGACQELLEGGTAEDRALGLSGIITPAATPQVTADALVRLWRDPALRQRMGQAGQRRVMRYYREETLYETYRQLYGSYLDATEVRPWQA